MNFWEGIQQCPAIQKRRRERCSPFGQSNPEDSRFFEGYLQPNEASESRSDSDRRRSKITLVIFIFPSLEINDRISSSCQTPKHTFLLPASHNYLSTLSSKTAIDSKTKLLLFVTEECYPAEIEDNHHLAKRIGSNQWSLDSIPLCIKRLKNCMFKIKKRNFTQPDTTVKNYLRC